jgi:hypothetical protein
LKPLGLGDRTDPQTKLRDPMSQIMIVEKIKMGFFIAITGVECQSVNEKDLEFTSSSFFLFPPKIILKN